MTVNGVPSKAAVQAESKRNATLVSALEEARRALERLLPIVESCHEEKQESIGIGRSALATIEKVLKP